MKNLINIGTILDTGKPAIINLDDIIEDRALIQANSRGGKSYLLRKLCEKAFGLIQIILIEPEGEYYTLREKFDFLLIGNKKDGADIQVSPKIAELLANKLLESGTSAIIDLSELLTPDKIKFVKLFADKLANESDKRLWHPVLVVLDEAHIFAPEKGQGEAESLNAVMALASKGGKRGYALVAATQRPAKLSKNVTTELNTKFIGRAGGYDDIQRAKQELGLPKSTSDSMFKIKHEFYAIGPALQVDGIIRIKADPVETTHKTNHLNYKTIVSTPAKIRNNLSVFDNIPEEADKELKTKQDMENKIRELEMKLRNAKPDTIVVPDKQLVDAAYQRGFKECEKQIIPFTNYLKDIIKAHRVPVEKFVNEIEIILQKGDAILKQAPDLKIPFSFETAKLPLGFPRSATNESKTIIQSGISSDTALTGPQRKVLTATVQRPHHRGTELQVALLSHYSPLGSAFQNPLRDLRKMGYVVLEGDQIVATAEGIKALGSYEPMPSDNQSLQNYWLNHLAGPERKVLKPLIEAYPNPLSLEETGEKSGYSIQGSAFQNPVRNLKKVGLIEAVPEGLICTKELFPEIYN